MALAGRGEDRVGLEGGGGGRSLTRRLKAQVEDEDAGWPAMILTSINRWSLACWGQLLYSHYTRPLVPHRAQCDVLNGVHQLSALQVLCSMTHCSNSHKFTL